MLTFFVHLKGTALSASFVFAAAHFGANFTILHNLCCAGLHLMADTPCACAVARPSCVALPSLRCP